MVFISYISRGGYKKGKWFNFCDFMEIIHNCNIDIYDMYVANRE